MISTVAVCETIAGMRELVALRRRAGDTIGFVPTMGALHAGHARLIERARAETGCVIVSIFVNPLQFDRADDLQKYPRTFDTDLALCQSLGVDAVFAPAVTEMYPTQQVCTIDAGHLADQLCGRFRGGHFKGVATVVMKLFQMVQADVAYFGEKDAQQLAIIRRLVADFAVQVRIVGVPTVREADGLALSSRNVRLSVHERAQAIALYQALTTADAMIRRGVSQTSAILHAAASEIPDDPSLRLEYLEIVDPDNLQPVAAVRGPVLIAGALWVGGTRLIDNIRCEGPAYA
jgi:pantoate--beta-alanine ligase